MKDSGQTILVTGGAGFIGSHLCEALVAAGHRVISLDNYFTGSTDNHVPGVEYRDGHTKDIEQHVPETPDLVFHLGEYSRVLTSFDDVAKVWDLNTAGTFSVLEFCRKKQTRLIYAGSSTKFGEFDDAEDGANKSPYAYFKSSNTQLVNNYGAWFGLDYAITYFYNVYGPRERYGEYGTVVEIFRQKMRAGESLIVYGSGQQRRAFTHVFDTVRGLLLVAAEGTGDGYCIGGTEEYSIVGVAEAFGGTIEYAAKQPGDRNRSKIDVSKLSELGWRPELSLRDYIETTKHE